jgi:hypothetical protein
MTCRSMLVWEMCRYFSHYPVVIDALRCHYEGSIDLVHHVQDADGIDSHLRLACSHLHEQRVILRGPRICESLASGGQTVQS